VEVIRAVGEMMQAAGRARTQGQVLGLVPTMGALHEGHLALIRSARQECGVVAVSIFVNPTQFGPTEDYAAYPRPLERDLSLCEEQGVDFVFHPQAGDMFPGGYSTYVEVEGLSEILCGASRPGHFRGVATVVLKLLNIVRPHRAYFGEKDYQQLVIIRRLVKDLNAPVEVVGVPTVRDSDGLALSSRNEYLSAEERQKALSLNRALLAGKAAFEKGERSADAIEKIIRKGLQKPGIVVEYIQVVEPESLGRPAELSGPVWALVAARVGKTRLIDNMLIGG
jgi:pantoate--beta-alanine ligase